MNAIPILCADAHEIVGAALLGKRSRFGLIGICLAYSVSFSLLGQGASEGSGPIDREALVRRNSPELHSVDLNAPFTIGNGGFAFTADITGLQTFGDAYYRGGIPLETLARWCWARDSNPHAYALEDASIDYVQADGSVVRLPTRMDSEAAQWLRRNPRLHPLGQVALEWDKPGGGAFSLEDVRNPHQRLDLWTGTLHSSFEVDGRTVEVVSACDPESDTLSFRIESEWVENGALRVRLGFPRGHDVSVKNTPALMWDHPDSHASVLRGDKTVVRDANGARYQVSCSLPLRRVGSHGFVVESASGRVLEFTLSFSESSSETCPDPVSVRDRCAGHWQAFWKSGGVVDFSRSSNPLAKKIEQRMVLSHYLTAVQCVGDTPAQESGLTCNTWYGKHHTEMIWWHNAHFILWGRPSLAEKNLSWFVRRLPDARILAENRGLKGVRWPKMVGPEGRESPGGNPLIVWNQPHPIYLAELLWRQYPEKETLDAYRDLVLESAHCMASMLHFDPERQQYVLGPPLWIAQEIHEPAESQNPSFELAYWHWALNAAQRWRERLGMPREAHWDHILGHLAPMPESGGLYVALESHPDTWTNLASRHDHPQMLMPLGFLPDSPFVDRATMDRTLTAVLDQWDWETKIWGWDYPMVAMTATRLGRPEDALEVLLRDGPNNRYTACGHCPQGSDRAEGQTSGRREIAAYLPANGAYLAALALMVAGWDGSPAHPGFPDDGSWVIQSEGLHPLP